VNRVRRYTELVGRLRRVLDRDQVEHIAADIREVAGFSDDELREAGIGEMTSPLFMEARPEPLGYRNLVTPSRAASLFSSHLAESLRIQALASFSLLNPGICSGKRPSGLETRIYQAEPSLAGTAVKVGSCDALPAIMLSRARLLVRSSRGLAACRWRFEAARPWPTRVWEISCGQSRW
jgi:hypothetical protein